MLPHILLAIEEASGVKVTGVIGRIMEFYRPPQDCYLPISKMFGKL
jgi:hypothetical protein